MLCLALFLSIASGIAWWNAKGPSIESPRFDATRYLAMAAGQPFSETPAPFRYRPWTPWLAGLLPDPPDSWLDPDRPLESQRAHIRFALVNGAGLALAAMGLFLLTRRELHSHRAGLAAGTIFLFSYYPLTVATLPMVEAWSYAFLVWALLLLLERKYLALAAVFLLGLTCKETILLVLPAAALLVSDRRERRRQAVALLPPTLLYVFSRGVVWPAPEPLYSLASTQGWLRDMFGGGRRAPANFAGALLAFHLLWIPAALALWRRRDEPLALVRWARLIPVILVVPFVLALVVGRVWFFAFPFVIPLAVAGLFDEARRFSRRA